MLHENIQATRVVTLFKEELDTLSKNKLIGITSGIKPICGINSLILHFLLFLLNSPIGLSASLRRINPTNSVIFPRSLVLRSIVLG